jgi:ribosome-binding protein aMBF1 (putative translation factor)
MRTKFLSLLLLAAFYASLACAADAPVCDGCGKKLTGPYYKLKLNGKTTKLCYPCKEKLDRETPKLRCDKCGKNISGKYSKVKQDGKELNLCPDCTEQIKRETLASAPACAHCGKKITGRYRVVTVNGEKISVCGDCMNRISFCQKCGAIVSKGAAFCDKCKREAPHCSLCGKAIIGAYSKFENGDVYCENCRDSHPHCPMCNRPYSRGQGAEKGGTTFCPKCGETVKVCGCCGKAILGGFFTHEFLDEAFCPDCENNNTKCGICKRPINGRFNYIGGNRPICPYCEKTSVQEQKTLDAIFADSQQLLLKILDEDVYHALPLTMEADLSAVRKNKELHDNKELGLFKQVGDSYHIYILFGITKAMAYETLPHEWAHAWCAEHGDPRHPQWVEEGFCQWVASKILIRKGFKRELLILQTRRDKIYGDGYRYAQSIEDKRGNWRDVITYMQNPPPSGAPVRGVDDITEEEEKNHD